MLQNDNAGCRFPLRCCNARLDDFAYLRENKVATMTGTMLAKQKSHETSFQPTTSFADFRCSIRFIKRLRAAGSI